MELMMYLGNDFIESVILDRSFISKPGYLGSYKRKLKSKYQSLLEETRVMPEFIVVNPIPALQATTFTAPAFSYH